MVMMTVRLVFYWRKFQGKYKLTLSAPPPNDVIKCPILGVMETNFSSTQTSLILPFQRFQCWESSADLRATGPPLQAAVLGGVGGEKSSMDAASHLWGREPGAAGRCCRSGATGVVLQGGCGGTDWEQREQLMMAYQRPRFTPSSCFWEWASSTAPQRRVWIWDLTFSNLIKLDE